MLEGSPYDKVAVYARKQYRLQIEESRGEQRMG